MGWTAHIQRTAKPGTRGGRRPPKEGVLSSMTFLRRQPEKTGRKLLFPQTTSPDSEKHADRFPSLSDPCYARAPDRTATDATSQFPHLSNGRHLLCPNSLTAGKKTSLEATGVTVPRKTSFRYKERISFSHHFNLSCPFQTKPQREALLHRVNG